MVTVWAATREAAYRVFAYTNAQVVVLKLNALIDILATAVVSFEGITLTTTAHVAAPLIATLLLTRRVRSRAFIYVLTATTFWVDFKTRVTLAVEGTLGIDAFTTVTAYQSRFRALALVYVHAFITRTYLVPCQFFFFITTVI